MNKSNLICCILIVVVLILAYTFSQPRIPINVDGRRWEVVASYENSSEAAQILSRCHGRMLTFMRKLREKYHVNETDDVIREHLSRYGNSGVGNTNVGNISTGIVGGRTNTNVGNMSANINTQSQFSKDLSARLDPRLHGSPAPTEDVQKIVETFLANYNPDVFYENDPRYSNDTSYTMNKGDSMYICLRKKKDPTQFEDEDIIFFVMLHECAHIANYNGWGHDDRFWTVFKFLLHEAVEAGVYTAIDYSVEPKDYCSISVYFQPLLDSTLPNLWEK